MNDIKFFDWRILIPFGVLLWLSTWIASLFVVIIRALSLVMVALGLVQFLIFIVRGRRKPLSPEEGDNGNKFEKVETKNV